jgi:hypothetical protein
MKKYYLFILLSFICFVNKIDQKIILDYFVNSEKYMDIYIENNNFKLIKSLLFKIIFLILFFTFPILAFINNLKNSNCNFSTFFKKLHHPISIFDPNLTSYNIYLSTNQKDMPLSKLDSYWHIFFTKYKVPFKVKLDSNDNFIKIQTMNNKIHSINYKNLELKNNKLIDITNNKTYKNNIISEFTLNQIKELTLKLHQRLNSKFKNIEWTIVVDQKLFYFISGNVYHKIINTKDKQYNKKFNHIMNNLLNTSPSNN